MQRVALLLLLLLGARQFYDDGIAGLGLYDEPRTVPQSQQFIDDDIEYPSEKLYDTPYGNDECESDWCETT